MYIVSFCLNHVMFFYICAAFSQFYRHICKLKCEPDYVSIKSNAAVTLLLPYHNNNNTKAKCLRVDCILNWR